MHPSFYLTFLAVVILCQAQHNLKLENLQRANVIPFQLHNKVKLQQSRILPFNLFGGSGGSGGLLQSGPFAAIGEFKNDIREFKRQIKEINAALTSLRQSQATIAELQKEIKELEDRIDALEGNSNTACSNPAAVRINNICMSYHANAATKAVAEQSCENMGGELAVVTSYWESLAFAEEFLDAFPTAMGVAVNVDSGSVLTEARILIQSATTLPTFPPPTIPPIGYPGSYACQY